MVRNEGHLLRVAEAGYRFLFHACVHENGFIRVIVWSITLINPFSEYLKSIEIEES